MNRVTRKLANIVTQLKPSNQRLKQQILEKKSQKQPFLENPRLGAVVQFFNKRANIPRIFAGLTAMNAEEIIVCEDGSSDGSLAVWQELLTKKNHYIIRSNDLFEVRTYTRALRMSSAEIVALLQDDDFPPSAPNWADAVLQAFDADPELAILGGRDALEILPLGTVGPGIEAKEGIFTYKILNRTETFKEILGQGGIAYAPYVNRSPVFVRRKAIEQLGGLDQRFAPFQNDDIDICFRAWMSGMKVGVISLDFQRNVGVGGMRLYNDISDQAVKNWKTIYEMYHDRIGSHEFNRLASQANERRLRK